MASWDLIETNSFPPDIRIDSEYYIGEGAREREKLKGTGKPFEEFFEKIVHPGEFTRIYTSTGHIFLRAQNVKPGRIVVDEPLFVSDDTYNSLPEAIVNEDDILIVRTGRFTGDSARVPKKYVGSLVSSHTLRLVPNMGAPVYALSIFFATEYGRRILMSLRTGGSRGQLNSFSLKTLYLPELSEVDARCRKIIQEIEVIESKADKLYPEAEGELLERIGWEDLNENSSEIYYKEDLQTLEERGRMDAEHYQPKYNRLLERLNKIGSKQLGSIWRCCDKGTQPDGYNDTGDVIVIKSKNVFGQGIELNACERTSFRAWEDKQARLQEKDIVINATGVGTLGRAGVVHGSNHKIVASVDLLIPRLHEQMIDPDYLTLFLNSPAGLAQSEQYQTGSSGQLHLYPEHLRKFVIFCPLNRDGSVDLVWQQTLAEKVRAAAHAKFEARAKLEEAKRLVESIIPK